MTSTEASASADVLPRAAELQRVLDTISGGLLVVGRDGLITLCNKEFRRFFGAQDAEWVQAPVRTVIDALATQMPDPVTYSARMATLAEATGPVYEHVMTTDGRVFECVYLPMHDETGRCGQVWHYWDVSEQHAETVERERRLRAEIIAQQLGVHAQRVRAAEAERTGHDLAERNRALVETDVLRQELVATASHELRTPLTTILSFSEMLAEDAPSGSDVAVYSAAINRNADRLLELVDDLLLLARIGSGTAAMAREPVDLSALLADAAQDAGASGAVVTDIAPDLLIIGDQPSLTRAIGNVLGNAVKYSDAGQTIRLAAHPADGAVRIAIGDDGIGIPADELDAIFGQFYRATTARQSGRPGTGLGLSIVRSILEQHGGTIVVQSAVEAGTTVTITLPTG